MQKWEYRHITGTAFDFEAELNLLGADGWDLVFVTVVPGTSPLTLLGIAKRPGQEHPQSEVSLEQL